MFETEKSSNFVQHLAPKPGTTHRDQAEKTHRDRAGQHIGTKPSLSSRLNLTTHRDQAEKDSSRQSRINSSELSQATHRDPAEKTHPNQLI